MNAVSEKRLKANRRNAGKSTGPRTANGKALVAVNPVAHGAFALCPVIDGVESRRDWSTYRKAMLAALMPVGMVEITLAERISLTAWRQRRVTRYETEQIRLAQEEAMEDVGRRLKFERDFRRMNHKRYWRRRDTLNTAGSVRGNS